MRAELVDFSVAYLMGWKTIRDFAEWLAGIDWDDPNIALDDLDVAGRLELLVTEVLEGLRRESEFWMEVAALVALETNSVYCQPVLQSNCTITIASSSNDTTHWSLDFMVAAVGESQSWSILPLQVSA